MRHGVHWHPGARANANRHRDARTHTAADGYAHSDSAHGHEHAVADGDGYSRAAHCNTGSTDCYSVSQAQLYAAPQAYFYLGGATGSTHRRPAG